MATAQTTTTATAMKGGFNPPGWPTSPTTAAAAAAAGAATVVVAGRRPPLQYQRSVCQLLASGTQQVTLRGAGRAAAMSLVLAAQMAAKEIVTIADVKTAVVPCADDDGSENGRLAVLAVTLERHGEWKGSRYIPTFISFVTEEVLAGCGSLAFSVDTDGPMGFALGLTESELRDLAAGRMEGYLQGRGICDSTTSERAIGAALCKAFDESAGIACFYQTCANSNGEGQGEITEEEDNGGGGAAVEQQQQQPHRLKAVYVRRMLHHPRGSGGEDALPPTSANSEECCGQGEGWVQGASTIVGCFGNEGVAGQRNSCAFAVAVVPEPGSDKEQFLRDLQEAGWALVEAFCDVNSRRGTERSPKIMAVRVEPFGFTEGRRCGASPTEVAERLVRGIDAGFHLHQAPRLQFICGSPAGDAVMKAWMDYTGVTEDALLRTSNKFRLNSRRRRQPSKRGGAGDVTKRRQQQQQQRQQQQQQSPETAQKRARRRRKRKPRATAAQEDVSTAVEVSQDEGGHGTLADEEELGNGAAVQAVGARKEA